MSDGGTSVTVIVAGELSIMPDEFLALTQYSPSFNDETFWIVSEDEFGPIGWSYRNHWKSVALVLATENVTSVPYATVWLCGFEEIWGRSPAEPTTVSGTTEIAASFAMLLWLPWLFQSAKTPT